MHELVDSDRFPLQESGIVHEEVSNSACVARLSFLSR